MPSSMPSSVPSEAACDQWVPVTYRIDAADRLIWVNRSWRTFAARNEGDAVAAPDPGGARFWELLGADSATVQIYQRLVARVRASGGEVQFAFRCDAPDRCRLLQMTIRALGDGMVEFQVDSLADRTRTPVPLLDVGQPHSSDVQLMCGWCNRVRMPDGAWMEVDDAIGSLGLFVGGSPPSLSHGICERCLTEFTTALDVADSAVAVVRPAVSISL